MLFFQTIFYNKYYPLKVWATTLIVGTGLHILSSPPEHFHPEDIPYFVELLTGTIYSLFTLAVSYMVFLFLIRTSLTYKSIKPIIAITGCVCSTATLMLKFNFGFNEIDRVQNLNLIASYCFPLAASCFLIRLRKGKVKY